ncbi:menaquinone biosynthetic enzyme MqnA/MqnD family protein [Ammoniphilus sp. CFH 90114]|uniref:menaquinone biosynthetic enzyme MqnA/MqnD family protein n=1 Tax=Ammoniphilus sp. CFH 90114 TaxID=2493665 RepID=UPI00100DD0A1|nr:menaquinone biosynthesis protein [Ammoniphilus sp. CFH 90114]RXT13905.1 ABC transporter substrate-binding protein [Ammoniphilus sp. CFH 90114]
MSRIQIGKISYSNVLPVFHFFRDARFTGRASFTERVPAELNRQLAAGDIDLGPVSSFAYAENAASYQVLGDLSVSALGAVGSIFMFSKRPLEELREPCIALTNSSATSVNLLKIIMEKFHGSHPKYQTVKPNLLSMMKDSDAALLIGDDALLAKWNNPGYYVYDLGELWYKHTGMWMTFALWTVRNQVIEHQPDLLREIHHEFLRSKQQGLEQLDHIILHAKEEFGGTYEFWKAYFSGLCYDFQSDQKRGLEYYFRCAAELGLLSRPIEVKIWDAGAKIT